MEHRLAAGRQANEYRPELNLQNIGIKTAESVALADQLVMEFLVMELTKPHAAQLARTAGDGAQQQFISSTFDRNPALESLAASAVSRILGSPVQSNIIHHREEFEGAAITIEDTQHLRLLYQIREVLQRRYNLQNSTRHTVEIPRSTIAPIQPVPIQLHNQDSFIPVKTACSKESEKQKLLCIATLMQNLHMENSISNDLTSQLDTGSGLSRNSASVTKTAQMLTQDRPVVRVSKITEKLEGKDITMSVKVYMPTPPPGVKCSYIGRLIGPNGITIRELQMETRCHIAIRGRGSIKDSKLLRKMRHKPGFGHLREDTHVLLEAKAQTRAECRNLIEKAKKRISDMFTPEFDSLKREQLIHLAMLNGTYRHNSSSSKDV